MDFTYIYKYQILIDIYIKKPIHKNATQEMIDELKEEGFLNKKGTLSSDGISTAKIITLLFLSIENFPI